MPQQTIKPVFENGEIVYLISDPEQLPRIVIGYLVNFSPALQYQLRHADEEYNSFHWAPEISRKKKGPIEESTGPDEEE